MTRAFFYVLMCMIMINATIRAEDRVLLIPENSSQEMIALSADSVLATETVNEEANNSENDELSELDDDFEFPKHMTLTIGGTVTVMAAKFNIGAGYEVLGGFAEVGVDASFMAVLAGKSGGYISEVGVYAKIRLIPLGDGKKVYFKGRYYYAFGANEDFRYPTEEIGIGIEKKDGYFYELTIQHWHDKSDGDDIYMPFISFGKVWGAHVKAPTDPKLFEPED